MFSKSAPTTRRAVTIICAGAVSAFATCALPGVSMPVEAAPAIRLSAANRVPACVTPDRLDRFLADQIRARGYQLDPRFRNIANWYRQHGKRHRVRWDFAFFQMALETNFLSFRRGNGKRGDVHPRQNNFAGLGTTGGGVPGDRYPNVSTGVLAQIQHLVVYSGQRLRNPVGHRTRLKQDVILSSVRRIVRRRPVTFADLAGRWAADRRYGRSIRRLAKRFYSGYCQPIRQAARTAAAPRREVLRRPVRKAVSPQPRPFRKSDRTDRKTTRITAPGRRQLNPPVAELPRHKRIGKRKLTRTASVRPSTSRPPPSRSVTTRSAPFRPPTPAPLDPRQKLQLEKSSDTPVRTCRVQTASFGGKRAVLIESPAGKGIKLTALSVQPGFEISMAENFIQAHAPDGRTIGAYASRDLALAAAHHLCRRRTASAR